MRSHAAGGPRGLIVAMVALVVILAPELVAADDVGITSARLIEMSPGRYAIEADVSTALLAALRPPVFPERFTPIRDPEYRRVAVGMVVRYEYGSDEPLRADESVLLPWARSAVLLTARWADGEVGSGMFPRSVAGIPIAVAELRPLDTTAGEISVRSAAAALSATGWVLVHVLFGVSLGVGGVVGAGRLSLWFGAGAALSMIAADFGAGGLAPGFALVLVALGIVLIARAYMAAPPGAAPEGLGALALAVGLTSGLGCIGMSTADVGVPPGNALPAVFGGILVSFLTVLAGGLSYGLAATVFGGGATRVNDGPRVTEWAAPIAGCLAVVAMLWAFDTGGGAGGYGLDPADGMAAASLEFGPGAAAATGGAVAPPRSLDEPALTFVTVEPQEVRVEILVSLKDFLEPLGIEGGPRSVVSVEVQDAIAERTRAYFGAATQVSIDGRVAEPIMQRTDFVTVAPTGVSTREQPRAEPLATAVLGITAAFETATTPRRVELTWGAFPSPDVVIPAVWTDPTGAERVDLTPESATLSWANDLSAFAEAPLEAITVRPPRWPLASWFLVLLAAGVAIFGGRYVTFARRAAVALLVAATVAYPFSRRAIDVPVLRGGAPAEAEVAVVVDDLLTNVYRSFELRREEAIYDQLAISVAGDQLTDVYLENRRALEIENRGGARANVDEVEVSEIRSVRRHSEGGFLVEAVWTVAGSVNHFGHIHYRQNRYDAQIRLVAVDGAWRILGIELLDERRII